MSSSIQDNQFDEWISWFQGRESASAINKAHQEQLFKTFDASVSETDCLLEILKHEETVYIHKVNFGSGNVALFHHLVEVGGTLYDSGSKDYGFIQGLRKLSATFLKPDFEILKKLSGGGNAPVPTMTHLLAVSSVDEVNSLVTSATVQFRPRNFIPVPPFLVKEIDEAISKSNGDAKRVLIKCVEIIKEFDSEHNTDADYKEKAKSKCRDLLFWLYLVLTDNNSIEAVSTIGCNNEKVIKALQKITLQNLSETKKQDSEILLSLSTQVENSLKRPFEVLAATSSSTTDFLERLTQIQNQNHEKSSKSFKKIPARYQNMILVAASIGEITEVEYSSDATEFFKCSNALNAQVMLNSLLETKGIECSVSSAMVSALLYGSFLWKNALSPSGFAASVLTSEGIFKTDTLHEGMVLDYSTKFDMSSSSLNKLTKSQVLFPVDIEELSHRIRAIQVLASFFFGKHSYMSIGLKRVVNFCLDNKMLFRTRLYTDSAFIAKMICSIDERIYQWLKQCSSHSMVIDTDLSLMEFTHLILDIQLNRFNYVLPPSIAKLVTEDNEDSGLKPKKKRKEQDNDVVTVRNKDLNSEWKLRPGETWRTVFRKKSGESPKLSMNCNACLKYHVKGFCYSDCRFKDSHCSLVDDDMKKVENFVKSLRGE